MKPSIAYKKGRKTLGAISIIFTIIFFMRLYSYSNDFQKSRKPFFASSEIPIDEENIRSYFGDQPQDGGVKQKVLFVLLDGLRYDALQTNPEMAQWLSDISADSKVVKVKSQLPAISLPNWMSLLTGSPPEFHGIRSNDKLTSNLDTFFERADRFNLKRGIAGNRHFSDALKASLRPMLGDGTLPYNPDLEDPSEFTIRHEPYNAHDEITARIIYDAINTTAITGEPPYDLLLAYFSDIDARAHQHGSVSERYNSAVANKTKILRQIAERIDDSTVLVITADHGHVNVGGHAGLEDHVTDVPVIIYKKNSQLEKRAVSGTLGTNLDIPPTICMLLGIPVPRHGLGNFLLESLPLVAGNTLPLKFRDLFLQKQNFISQYMEAVGGTSRDVKAVSDPWESGNISNASLLEEYNEKMSDIMEMFWKQRNTKITTESLRNLMMMSGLSLIFLTIVLAILHKRTVCDLRFFKIRISGDPNLILNCKMFFVAFLTQSFHLLVTWALVVFVTRLIWRGSSDWMWGFSIFNSAIDGISFCVICGIVSLIVFMSLIHVTQIWICLKSQRTRKVVSRVFFTFGFRPGSDVSHPKLYLFRYYSVFWSLCFGCLVTVLQSVDGFFLPGVYAVKYITPVIWTLKFTMIAFGIFVLPVMGYFPMTLVWGWNKDQLVYVYEMYLDKLEHKHYRQSMLLQEEELVDSPTQSRLLRAQLERGESP